MARKFQVPRLRDKNGRFKKDGPYVKQHIPTHSHIIGTNIISRFCFRGSHRRNEVCRVLITL